MNFKKRNQLRFLISLAITVILIYTTFIKESTPIIGFLGVMLFGVNTFALFMNLDNDKKDAPSMIGSFFSGLTDISGLGNTSNNNTFAADNNNHDNYGNLSFTERHKIREAVKEIEKAKRDYRIK